MKRMRVYSCKKGPSSVSFCRLWSRDCGMHPGRDESLEATHARPCFVSTDCGCFSRAHKAGKISPAISCPAEMETQPLKEVVSTRYILRLISSPYPTLVSKSFWSSDSCSSWFLFRRHLLEVFHVPGAAPVEGTRPPPSWNPPPRMVPRQMDKRDSQRDEIATVRIIE